MGSLSGSTRCVPRCSEHPCAPMDQTVRGKNLPPQLYYIIVMNCTGRIIVCLVLQQHAPPLTHTRRAGNGSEAEREKRGKFYNGFFKGIDDALRAGAEIVLERWGDE